ncbi:hypothetical protein K2V62_11480 [Mammaliicoccus sciuri]|uniref:hypothetical protein n=1 Tax=Mammaliicoccus sciuri TaxID=1296 RepID=UPI0009C2FB68|nr:hypothetical protein [Mammaliicoccus sciuri]ARB39718.1 hypothetical protein B5728_01905 [Mammaliicoccus sciuri]MCD8895284.1 hypothetical protein [Mammaliicoccus sciuri]MCD8913491.1 hypothetical protein [Mammaliicoccus sciuri]PNZ27976.1 hypothetical protein CD114_05005 [Mammaliicoccus sciuri]
MKKKNSSNNDFTMATVLNVILLFAIIFTMPIESLTLSIVFAILAGVNAVYLMIFNPLLS